MKKNIFIIFILSVFVGQVYSQFDAQFSQYMLHNVAFNPAAAGQSGMIDITGQQRFNFVGIPGVGATSLVTVTGPLKIGKTDHGLGVSFLRDEFGLFSNQSYHLKYAFRKPLGEGILSVGADLGYTSLGFAGDSLTSSKIDLGDYHDFSGDPAMPTSSVVGGKFDMGLGAMYVTDKWYGGVSFQHLNKPVITWSNTTEFTQHPMMYLTGGMNFKMTNPKYTFKPDLLFKTDFAEWAFDLTARIDYDSKYWGGVSYRLLDAVVLLAGVNIGNGLTIGYSADISTNKLITANFGSHEILLAYSFEYIFAKNSTKYKSIRFL